VGINITSIQNSILSTSVDSKKSSNGTFSARLAIADSDAATNSTKTTDAAQRATRSATLQLSAGVTSINTRESFTQKQQVTVEALLAKAREIKSEVDPVRSSSLASDAASLISSAETEETNSLRSDSTLDDDQTIQVTLDSSIAVGNSARSFSTSIDAVSSLSDIGVTSSLSFSSSNIDSTISTLEAAQQTLLNKQSAYESSRSDISSEISTRGVSAQLRADLAGSGIEKLAGELSKKISASAESLLANNNVGQLDISSLIADDSSQSSSIDSSSAE